MADRVTISDGEMHSESLTGFNTHSSSNYEDTGVKAKTSLGFSRTVQSADQLDENDLIDIDNMQVTVKMAREMGLLGRVFDEELSMSAAHTAAEEQKSDDKSNTGNIEYDTAIDNLNGHLDNGSMSYDEAVKYEEALGEVALSEVSVPHLVETIEGLSAGTVAASDVPTDVKQIAESVEAKVTDAATSTAISELGQEGFSSLQNIASLHPAANEVIRRYAIDRAQGLHQDVTWSDLYDDLREQLNIA